MNPERDPLSYELITYAWVAGISLWGGTSAWLRRSRATERYSLVEWLGECVISGGVGVLTFYLCELAGTSQLLSAVLIAITAHMGSRAILLGEKILTGYLGQRFGIKEEPGENAGGDK